VPSVHVNEANTPAPPHSTRPRGPLAQLGESPRIDSPGSIADNGEPAAHARPHESERERAEALAASDRREAERQKEHLNSLLTQAPVAIVVLRGADHRIELVNPVVCGLWGREQSTLVDRPLFEALPELRAQPWKGLLDHAFHTGEPCTGKEAPALLDRRGDGSLETIYFNFVYTPLRNSRNEVDGILVIATDVTAEVRAREDLDRLRLDAERATKAKDRFLAVLSHELRTPLTSLLLQLELLRRRAGGDRRDLGIIIDAMERAVKTQSRLTDDLLDISRIVAGKLDLQMRPLEFISVVREAVDTVRPLAEHKGVGLEVGLETAFVPVMGDGLRLRQAVWNLLVNAVKFTPPEGLVTIRVAADGATVRLDIVDTGAGIAAEFLPQVFDLFEQGGAGEQGGLGLGLTIVRHVIELHYGKVHADSAGPGRGATFTVTLPVLSTTSDEERLLSPVEMPAAPSHHVPLAGLQVLLVEDDPEIREPLRAMMTEAGAVVVAIPSAEEALRVLDRMTPNLLVCDIALPGRTGHDFVRQLRARGPGRGGDIPALALTARASEEDRRESYAAGFQHHLSKPVGFDEFMEAVLTVTGRTS
jgi:PAS domain S-box-containing protein